MSASTNRNAFQFADLLSRAVSEPGTVSQAYLAFHTYSIGNQLLALAQCMARGIQAGPLATYQRWRELGRYVRKGEKALVLCRPVTVKRGKKADDSTEGARIAHILRLQSVLVHALANGRR